jgi:thioesterase domain-containing protein
MPLGPDFARVLGPEQPLYAINASGMDGRGPVVSTLRDMVPLYVAEVEGTRPAGPIVVGGMCDGAWAAIELARALLSQGRQVGPVILADPPVFARSYGLPDATRHATPQVDDAAALEINRSLQQKAEQAGAAFQHPGVGKADAGAKSQLYHQVRKQLLEYASRQYLSMPFDVADPDQLHVATLAGIGAMTALCSHLPTPFPGPVQVILSDRRALGFFHSELPWRALLPGHRMALALPGDHIDLFGTGRGHVARAIKFMLEQGPRLQVLPARTSPQAAPLNQDDTNVAEPMMTRA